MMMTQEELDKDILQCLFAAWCGNISPMSHYGHITYNCVEEFRERKELKTNPDWDDMLSGAWYERMKNL